ncbi:wbbd [hydrocarbon metagenome]|uniref:Wbbd n=1 Tax=hydrocarbon metagenome TaxID=938273 RepID=A0A0W8F708_9ZZZZ
MKFRSFYHAFEDRFRGSRELIKSRLRIYLPFVIPLKAIYDDCRVIDLGCGRGEWLELMVEEGFEAHGVDLDESMLAISNAAGLSIVKSDIIEYLQKILDNSVEIVSGFQIIEHISSDSLQILVKEAFRVLKPGGLLILETPNPENLLVSTTEFYLDPTHNKPIPPKLLYFLAEYNGFARIKLLRMQESQSISSLADDIGVTDIFFAVSPDYAVVAQKRAPDEQMSLFDQAFNRDYGRTIDDLALLYAKKDQQLAAYEHDRWQWLESEWNTAKVRIDQQAGEIFALRDQATQLESEWNTAKVTIDQQAGEIFALRDQATQLEAQLSEKSQALDDERKKVNWLESEWNAAKVRIEYLNLELQSVYSSRCWRITAPLRAGFDLLLRLKGTIIGISHVLRRKIGSIASPLLDRMVRFAIAHPSLKARALTLVHMCPRLDAWLYSFAQSRGLVADSGSPQTSSEALVPLELWDLSPDARRIYLDLKASMERNRRHN